MRILILQAGFNEIGVIQNLKAQGHYVISIGNQPGLIGQQYVDEYYCKDYSKKDEVLKFYIEHKIDRICACCNDTAVLTATYVAEKMGLKGYDSYESAKIIAHKNLFKRFVKRYNLLSIPAEEFCKVEDARDYIKSGLEYPIIIKPIDLSGGKGVAKCENESEALLGVEQAFAISREKCIVIEKYIEGTQHGFCTFLHNQKVIACCSNNEYSVVNPYRVEIDTFPADNIRLYQEVLIQQVEFMAEKLNLVDGIFHLQYIESKDGIYILEAMRRIIGNMYSIPASKAIDFDWDYWQARASIGEVCSDASQKLYNNKYYAYRAIIAPKDGIIEEVTITPEIEKYIFQKCMFMKNGEEVVNYKASTIGMLFLEFDNQEQMKEIMLSKYDQIYVTMKSINND